MGYSLFIAKGAEIYDVTEFSGNITWSDSIDTLGMQLDFSVAYSNERYFPKFSIDPGDIAVFKNETEIFRGIVTSKSYAREEQTITAFDFCFYLNKSKVVKQFNSINASDAITQLCETLNIKVGGVDKMETLINHIYYDKTAAEIIEDILEQETAETGKKYIKEMQGDSFYIFERTSKIITPQFKPAINIAPFDAWLAAGEPSRELSIEDMRNSILIVSGNEKSVRTIASAKDENSINKYGLLQEIESVDEKNLNKAQNTADNKLKELNVVKETVSIELLGDDTARAGRVIYLEEETSGIKGKYIINSCSHTLSGGVHTMSLELEYLSVN